MHVQTNRHFYKTLHYLMYIIKLRLFFLALIEIFIPLITLHIAVDIAVDMRVVQIGL